MPDDRVLRLTDLLLLVSPPDYRRHVLVMSADDGSTVLHMSTTSGTTPLCNAQQRLIGGICDAQALLLSVFLGDVPCDDCARLCEQIRAARVPSSRETDS